MTHRVANRIGYVTTTDPEETVKILKEAALKIGDNPSKYLDAIANWEKIFVWKNRDIRIA